MHKIFGEKKNVQYLDRKGAYLIPIHDGKIAVVKTEKGYFFLGGGFEENETDEECIRRECLEEIGYDVEIQKYIASAEAYTEHPRIGYFHPIQKYYVGKLLKQAQEPKEHDHSLVWIEYEKLRNNMFAEIQNWALDECWRIFKTL